MKCCLTPSVKAMRRREPREDVKENVCREREGGEHEESARFLLGQTVDKRVLRRRSTCVRAVRETRFLHVEFAVSVEPQGRLQGVSAYKNVSLGESLEAGNHMCERHRCIEW